LVREECEQAGGLVVVAVPGFKSLVVEEGFLRGILRERGVKICGSTVVERSTREPDCVEQEYVDAENGCNDRDTAKQGLQGQKILMLKIGVTTEDDRDTAKGAAESNNEMLIIISEDDFG
jgi:hypothetical protein